MHGHWFISLREQDHEFLGSALHFIQITWFTYVFANIRRVTKWVQKGLQDKSFQVEQNPFGDPNTSKIILKKKIEANQCASNFKKSSFIDHVKRYVETYWSSS